MTESRSPGQPGGPGTGGISGTDQPPDLDDVKREVEDAADVAMERGRGFAAAARGHAFTFAEGRKAETARSVGDLADSLRSSSRTFDDRPNIKAFFDSAAEGLEELAGSIEKRSFADFYADAEQFARRSPVAVAAATFAVGFLLARFVKASGSDERDLDDGFHARVS